MAHLKVLAIKYAESTLPESAVFQGGRCDKRLLITFVIYLLETENRRILVDAGCDTMPGFEMVNYYRPVDVLKDYGYAPEDITDVIITHAHHDHIAAVGHYKNAVVHIQEDEYAPGKKYIADEAEVNIFKETYSLDDNILIRKIGGHSKGSCVVEFAYDNICYVVAGDECYARECLINKIPTGSSYDLENSTYFVEEYSKEEYCVLLCHEAGVESGYIIK